MTVFYFFTPPIFGRNFVLINQAQTIPNFFQNFLGLTYISIFLILK